MSKRGIITRYLFIIKKLKAKPNDSFEEFQTYIDKQFGITQLQNESLLIGFLKTNLST